MYNMALNHDPINIALDVEVRDKRDKKELIKA